MRVLRPILVWLAACATAAPLAAGGDLRPGADRILLLDEVVVVYPSAPTQEAERNRISALNRAGYLEARGVRTRVVADDRAGPEELDANLLVLGWGNRLLGGERAPAPFARGATGFVFLGLEESSPDADLLFAAPSPYNPERFLVFWSRIDPERDRFAPLPRTGSDWAIVRDFKPVRQGMFAAGGSWPPALNPETTRDNLRDLEKVLGSWTEIRTDHYVIRYDPAALPEQEVRGIAAARERALARAAEVLAAPRRSTPLTLYVYQDAERKAEITGVEDAAHSLPRKGEIHMLERHARSASPHEEIHVLAREALGPCSLTSLYEGLALWEDRTYDGMEIEVRAALMVEAGTFPALGDLLDESAARRLPAAVRFPAAGMLAGWLRGSLDRAALAKAYTLTEGSAAALAAVAGRPAAELEAAFRKWVAGRAATRAADLEFLKREAEARERLLVGDYPGVAAALEKALLARPDDPQTLFNLASALMRAGEYPRAGKTLRRILELPPAGASAGLIPFSHYQLGRVYDLEGRREQALLEYRRVLELPDDHDVHRLAREAIERPVTVDQLD